MASGLAQAIVAPLLLLLLLLLSVAPAGATHAAVGKPPKVQRLHQKHVLRVCNAYPSASPLVVQRGEEVLTGQQPLEYKKCRELKFAEQGLEEGDELHVAVQDGPSNTFELTELPRTSALLLLIAKRDGDSSTDLTFDSHVFDRAQPGTTQAAVIDAYDGQNKSKLLIGRRDDSHHGEIMPQEAEELRYGSIVAVNPGAYRLWLEDDRQLVKDSSQFVALDDASYVVIRVGGAPHETSKGVEFPQELVVFPESTRAELESRSRTSPAAALSVLLLHVLAFAALRD